MMNPLISVLLSLLGAAAPQPAAAADEPVATERAESDAGTTVRYKSALGQQVAAALPEIFASKLNALDKRRLGSKVFSESRITITRGNFPDGGKLVVFVNVNLRNRDPEAPPKFIGGVLTLSDSAGLAAIALPLQTRTQRLDLEAVTDVEGDGIHEIVYTAKDQTSTTRHRIRWTDEGPKSSELPAG